MNRTASQCGVSPVSTGGVNILLGGVPKGTQSKYHRHLRRNARKIPPETEPQTTKIKPKTGRWIVLPLRNAALSDGFEI